MDSNTELAAELAADRGANRALDARIAVSLYRDDEREDPRDNTHARLPSKADGCAPGTYWISAFSGLSLRTAPDYTSDRTLKRLALTALTQQPADHIPDASNMVPSEQIAYGALGVTQRDRNRAADLGEVLGWSEHVIRDVREGNRDYWPTVQAFARHAQQARAQALEEAAKVADRHEGKPCGHAEGWTDEQRQFYDAGQLDASTSIASAIRALQPHGQGGGE